MYIEREIIKKFKKVIKAYPVVAIVGPRQAGKTTFLKECSKGLNSSYLVFDDPDIRDIFEEDIKKFENQYLEGHELSVLDEVQYCRDSGRKLKYLADKGRKLWITSSSEIILSKEVLSYLVGRVSILKLYPFSITEYLSLKGQKELTAQILTRHVEEHIQYGGYPKVAITEDIELKKIILKDLYDTMVLKDIARTFSIDDIRSLEDFVKYLALNIGCLLSYDTISNDLKLSFQTVKKYMDAMEKSYLMVKVPPYYTNKTKEITKQPRVYFLDTGLRNVIIKQFNVEPDGKLFENYVFSELTKLGFTPKYWRTKSKAEVDFIIQDGKDIIPIETKLNADKAEKSMQSFIEAYKPKKALIVTLKGKMSKMKVNKCDVHFTNVLNMRNLLSEF